MARMRLGDMMEALRAEIGASLSPGHNLSQDATHAYILSRTQRELQLAHDWPHLFTEELVDPVTAGTQYVTGFDTDYELINEVWGVYGGEWYPLRSGFGPEQYNEYSSPTERSYPVRRYRPYPLNEGIEIWPIPVDDTKLIIRGQMSLPALRDPDDMSLLDGTLIVLFAAADIVADLDRNDAARLGAKAAAYLRLLRANLSSQKGKITPLTGTKPNTLRPFLDYIPESMG